jgi:hypothetical protein
MMLLRRAILLLLCFVVQSALGTTVTVNLKNTLGQNYTSDAEVHFILINYGGYVPKVSGSIISSKMVIATPDGSGNVTVSLYGNDVITPLGTAYKVEYWVNGSYQFSGTYCITGSAADLSQLASCVPVAQPTTLPTDAIYARLDSSNMPFTGAINTTGMNSLFSSRVTSVGSGLQTPSVLTLNLDAVNGGVNNILTTKTQFQSLRFNVTGRTIGERKGIQGFTNCYAKGDCIGVYGLSFDSGGYLTSGDEGTHGLDGWAIQGSQDAYTTDGGFPRGIVTAVVGDTITVSWTAGTNAHLGSYRPLINTSRGVYNTGTISTITGSPCVVTGAASLWNSLTSGAHTDLFLNVTGNDNGTVKHVVPLTLITDNTHAVVEYKLAEIGDTCYGPTMTRSGTYNIYKGGTIASLVDAGIGNDPVSVVLGSGQGANFQVGDSVQSPLGYNFNGVGVWSVVSRLIGEPSGSLFRGLNVGTKPLGDVMYTSGPFTNGWRNGGNLSGAVIKQDGTYDSFLNSTDISPVVQTVIQVLNSGSTARKLIYDRPNDWWHLSGLFIDGSTTRISTNSTPQANTEFYLGYGGSGFAGLIIAPTAAPNSGVAQLDVQTSGGTSLFRVEGNGSAVKLTNGANLIGYSDNGSTQKFGIAGATGLISRYAGIPTVNSGVASEVATIDLGSLTADIGFTNAYVVPADGMYRVSAFIGINRAATTSSTMPALWITFQSADGLGTPTFLTNTDAANTTSTAATNISYFKAAAGSSIVYKTLGYASTGGTSMQYTIHIVVEQM